MPPVAAGALESVRCRKHSELREHHQERARSQATTNGGRYPGNAVGHTHRSCLVGDPVLCKQASDDLHNHGIYVQPINYPHPGHRESRFTPAWR